MSNRSLVAAVSAAALFILGGLAAAQQGQPGRMTGITMSGDQPIQIESDRLEVRDNENMAIFTGNVSVVQGETLMRSGRMIVHYADNEGGDTSATGSGDIERLEVDGGVYVRSEGQVATGDRGTFDMRTEVLVLEGDEVVLTEGDNVVVGCQLTVQMATGLATLDGCDNGSGRGRVKMLLQPGSQNR